MPDDADDPKPALRQLYRDRRRGFVATLTAAARKSHERDLARVLAPRIAGVVVPASYAAVGAEIDPSFVETALGPHAFPRVAGAALTFHRTAWSDLAPGYAGIPEPPATAPPVIPDLVLVPLLAATPAGVRLGQGGGFYDRALVTLRARGTVVAIGLAWDCQLADFLPEDPWDARLDWIATPTRLVECARHR